MREPTDEERGTEPETLADWKHDLEGASDTPHTHEPPPTSEAGHGAQSVVPDAEGESDPTAPPPTSEAGSKPA